MLILEVESFDAGPTALADLPLVARRIVDFELIQLMPFAAFATAEWR